MSENWTKGPWRFVEGDDNFKNAREEESTLGTIMGGKYSDIHICRIWGDITDDYENVEELANAHLIATAPEMYALLERVKDELFYHLSFSENAKLAVKAESFGVEIFSLLKKARGDE